MQTGFSPGVEHRAASLIDPDVSGIDDVEGTRGPKSKDSSDWIGERGTCEDESLLESWHV